MKIKSKNWKISVLIYCSLFVISLYGLFLIYKFSNIGTGTVFMWLGMHSLSFLHTVLKIVSKNSNEIQINKIMVLVAVEYLHFGEFVSKVVVTIIVIIVNYVTGKKIVFISNEI